MVNKHANQLVADSLVHERCGNCRIDATRKATDHSVAANLCTNLGDLIGDDVIARPIGGQANLVVQKVFEHVLAELRMLHLWVPLHAIDFALAAAKGGYRRGCCASQHIETGRRFNNLVAVAHPTNLVCRLIRKDALRRTNVQVGCTVFAKTGLIDATAQRLRQDLKAIANAQCRNSQRQDTWV